MNASSRADRRPVQAVAISFFVNGILFSSLLPRFPQVAAQTGADEAAFGLALAGVGVGGLVGGIGAPALARSLGLVRTTLLMGVATAAAVVVVAASTDVLVLAAALALIGGADAAHDISMNEVALGEQTRREGSIMGRLHGIWSVGSTAGAAAGAAMAGLHVPVIWHLTGVGAVGIGLQVWAARGMRERASVDASGRSGRAAPPPGPEMAPAAAQRVGIRRRRWLTGIGLAVATLAAMLAEQSPLDWSALMLRRALDAGAGTAGLGPVVFSAGILAARGVIDVAVDRLGPGAVLRLGNGLAAVALSCGLLAAHLTGAAWPALVGLAVAGAGVAGNFPLLFGAGDRISDALGLPEGTGTSIVGTAPRVGSLILPAAIGAVAGAAGLIPAVALTAAGSAVVAVLLPRVVAPARERSASR